MGFARIAPGFFAAVSRAAPILRLSVGWVWRVTVCIENLMLIARTHQAIVALWLNLLCVRCCGVAEISIFQPLLDGFRADCAGAFGAGLSRCTHPTNRTAWVG